MNYVWCSVFDIQNAWCSVHSKSEKKPTCVFCQWHTIMTTRRVKPHVKRIFAACVRETLSLHSIARKGLPYNKRLKSAEVSRLAHTIATAIIVVFTMCCFALSIYSLSTLGKQSIITPGESSFAILKEQISTEKALSSDHWNHKKKTAVIIVTRYRSGSSFTGEIFNNHPDVFYIYEPLHGIFEHKDLKQTKYKAEAEASTIKEEVLSKLISCEKSKFYIPRPDLLSASRAIIQNLNCTRYQQTWRCIQDSLKHKPRLLEELCSKHNTIVIKTIRTKLRDVITLIKNSSSHVKLTILHVVRDPRGMMNSWMRSRSKIDTVKFKTAQESTDLCTSLYEDMLVAEEFVSLGNYFLLRYEDLAATPEAVADKIYRLLNIPLHENVHRWIRQNTNASLAVGGEVGEERRMGQYRRNSKATSLAWRSILDADDVSIIEENCKKFMEKAGYAVENKTKAH